MLRQVLGKYDHGSGVELSDFRRLCWELGRHLNDEEEGEVISELEEEYSAIHVNGTILTEALITWLEEKDEAWKTWAFDDATLRVVNRAAGLFAECDDALDGEITAREFSKLHKQLVAAGLTNMGFLACLKDVDREGDGVVRFNEFSAWIVRSEAGTRGLLTDTSIESKTSQNSQSLLGQDEEGTGPYFTSSQTRLSPRNKMNAKHNHEFSTNDNNHDDDDYQNGHDVAALQEAVRQAAAAAAQATEELAEVDREFGTVAEEAEQALAACSDADAWTARKEAEMARAEVRLQVASEEMHDAESSVAVAKRAANETPRAANGSANLSLFYSHTPVAVSQAVIDAAEELRLLQDEANDHKICDACDEALVEGRILGQTGRLDLSDCSAVALREALELAAHLGGAKTPRASWYLAATAQLAEVRDALLKSVSDLDDDIWRSSSNALDATRLRDAAARLEAEAEHVFSRENQNASSELLLSSSIAVKELVLVYETADARTAASALRRAVAAPEYRVAGVAGSLDARGARSSLRPLQAALETAEVLRESTSHVNALADAGRAILRLREAVIDVIDADVAVAELGEDDPDDFTTIARSDSVGSHLSTRGGGNRNTSLAATTPRPIPEDDDYMHIDDLLDSPTAADATNKEIMSPRSGSRSDAWWRRRMKSSAKRGGVSRPSRTAALSSLANAVSVVEALLDSPLCGGGDDDAAGSTPNESLAVLLGSEHSLVETELHERVISRDLPGALADGRTTGKPGTKLRLAANDATLAALRSAVTHASAWAPRCGTARALELESRATLVLACRERALAGDWSGVEEVLAESESEVNLKALPPHKHKKRTARAITAADAEIELFRAETCDRKLRAMALRALASSRVTGTVGAINVESCSAAELFQVSCASVEDLGGPRTEDTRRLCETVSVVSAMRAALTECEGLFADEWDSNNALQPAALRPAYEAIELAAQKKFPEDANKCAKFFMEEGGDELGLVLHTAEARRVAKALRNAASSTDFVVAGTPDCVELAGPARSLKAIDAALTDFDALQVPTPHTSALAALCRDVRALRAGVLDVFAEDLDEDDDHGDDDDFDEQQRQPRLTVPAIPSRASTSEADDDNDDEPDGLEDDDAAMDKHASLDEREVRKLADASLTAALEALQNSVDVKLESAGDDNAVRNVDEDETRGDVVGIEVSLVELAFHDRVIARDIPRAVRRGHITGVLGALKVDVKKNEMLDIATRHATEWAGKCGTRAALELLSTGQIMLACRTALADADWEGLDLELNGPPKQVDEPPHSADDPYARFAAWAPHGVHKVSLEASEELAVLRDAVDDFKITEVAAAGLGEKQVRGEIGSLDLSDCDPTPLDEAVTLATKLGGAKTERAVWILDMAHLVRRVRAALLNADKETEALTQKDSILSAPALHKSLNALAQRQPEICANEKELGFDEMDLVLRTLEAEDCATTLVKAIEHPAHRPTGEIGALDVEGCVASVPVLKEAIKKAARIAKPTPRTKLLIEAANAALLLRDAVAKAEVDDDADANLATAVDKARTVQAETEPCEPSVAKALQEDLELVEREMHDRRIARRVSTALSAGRVQQGPDGSAVPAATTDASVAALEKAHAHAEEWSKKIATPRATALKHVAHLVLNCRRAVAKGDWDMVEDQLNQAAAAPTDDDQGVPPMLAVATAQHVPEDTATEIETMQREVDARAIAAAAIATLTNGKVAGSIGDLDLDDVDYEGPAAVITMAEERALKAAKKWAWSEQQEKKKHRWSPRVARLLAACNALANRRLALVTLKQEAWDEEECMKPSALRSSLVEVLEAVAKDHNVVSENAAEGVAELELVTATADVRDLCTTLRNLCVLPKNQVKGAVGAVDARAAYDSTTAITASITAAKQKVKIGRDSPHCAALVELASALAKLRKGLSTLEDGKESVLAKAVAEAKLSLASASLCGGGDDDSPPQVGECMALDMVRDEVNLIEAEVHDRISRRELVKVIHSPLVSNNEVNLALDHAANYEHSKVVAQLRATARLVTACRAAAEEKRWSDVSRACEAASRGAADAPAPLCLTPTAQEFVQLVGMCPPNVAKAFVDASNELEDLRKSTHDDTVVRACCDALRAGRVTGDVGALELSTCDPEPLRKAIALAAKLGGAKSNRAAWLLGACAEVEACRSTLRVGHDEVDWGTTSLAPPRLAEVLHNQMGYPENVPAQFREPDGTIDESLGFAELFLVLHTSRARQAGAALLSAICEPHYKVIGSPGAVDVRGAKASIPVLKAAITDAENLVAPTPHTAALAETARAVRRLRESLVVHGTEENDNDEDKDDDEEDEEEEEDEQSQVLAQLLLADNAEVATAIAAAKALFEAPLFAGEDDDDRKYLAKCGLFGGRAPATAREIIAEEVELVEAEYNDRRIGREVPRALSQGMCSGRPGAVVVGANAATLVTLEVATLHAKEWARTPEREMLASTASLIIACRSAAVDNDWDGIDAALTTARDTENASTARNQPLGPGAPPSTPPREAHELVGAEIRLLQDEVNDRKIVRSVAAALSKGAISGVVGHLDLSKCSSAPLDAALDLAAELGGPKTTTSDRLVKTASALSRCRSALRDEMIGENEDAEEASAWETHVALSRSSLRSHVDELDAAKSRETATSALARSRSGDGDLVDKAANDGEAELRLLLRTAEARFAAAALRTAVEAPSRRVAGFPGAIDARNAGNGLAALDTALEGVKHLEVSTPHVDALARATRVARNCRAGLVRALADEDSELVTPSTPARRAAGSYYEADEVADVELLSALAAARDELDAPLRGGGQDDASISKAKSTPVEEETIATLLADELGLIESEVHDRRISREIPRALALGRCTGTPGAVEVEPNTATREIPLERAVAHAKDWVWRCATHTSAELLAAAELILACRRAAFKGAWRAYSDDDEQLDTVDAVLTAKRTRDNAHRATSSLGSSDALLGPGQPPVVTTLVPLAVAEIRLIQDEVNDRAILDACVEAMVGGSRVRGKVGRLDLSRADAAPLDFALSLATRLGGAKTPKAKRLLLTAGLLRECRGALLRPKHLVAAAHESDGVWQGPGAPLDPDRLADALADLERADVYVDPEHYSSSSASMTPKKKAVSRSARSLTGAAELRLIAETSEARATCTQLRSAVNSHKHRVAGACGLIDVRGAAASRGVLSSALARFAALSASTPHAEALAKVADAALRYRSALVSVVDAGTESYGEPIMTELASAVGNARALFALNLRGGGDDDAALGGGYDGGATAASLLQAEVELVERELHDRKMANDIPKALADSRLVGRLGNVKVSHASSLSDLRDAVAHAKEWAPRCATPHAAELLATAELALACRAAAARRDWRSVDAALKGDVDSPSPTKRPIAALGLGSSATSPVDGLRDASRSTLASAAAAQDANAKASLARAEAALADAKAQRERAAAASVALNASKSELEASYRDKLQRTQAALARRDAARKRAAAAHEALVKAECALVVATPSPTNKKKKFLTSSI